MMPRRTLVGALLIACVACGGDRGDLSNASGWETPALSSSRPGLDGALDCLSQEEWSGFGTPAGDVSGFDDPETALRDAMGGYLRDGRQFVMRGTHSASLMTEDGREVVVSSANRQPDDTWMALEVSGCDAEPSAAGDVSG